MTVSEKFRLGDMLSLTLRAPLSYRWPVVEDRALRLLCFMASSFEVTDVDQLVDVCAIDLCRQHPWLARLDIPDVVRKSCDWGMLYAWLDKTEREFGEWHEVSPLQDSAMPSRFAIDFSLLPPDVRTRLRELGFDQQE